MDSIPNDLRSIPGWPGYLVSADGRVISRRRKVEIELRQERTAKGYRRVQLADGEGNYVHVSVHALVLEAFVGSRPSCAQAAHLNGDPSDNRVANLAWVSVAENHRHKAIHGTLARGERQGAAKLTESDVREMRARLANGEHARLIANAFGVGVAAVYAIKHRRNWRHVA